MAAAAEGEVASSVPPSGPKPHQKDDASFCQPVSGAARDAETILTREASVPAARRAKPVISPAESIMRRRTSPVALCTTERLRGARSPERVPKEVRSVVKTGASDSVTGLPASIRTATSTARRGAALFLLKENQAVLSAPSRRPSFAAGLRARSASVCPSAEVNGTEDCATPQLPKPRDNSTGTSRKGRRRRIIN